MGLRLAYYYSSFITGGVTLFLSVVLLFTLNVPQPRRDELFIPFYIFLKLQVLLPTFELFLSLTPQRIDPTLVVMSSICGRIPILTAVIRPEYSIFTLVLGILYGLGDILRALYAADKIDVGVPFKPLVWLRYHTPMWFYPVTTLIGEFTVLFCHIRSLMPYTAERKFWIQFTLSYYSLFPVLYFVHCILYYRNINRPTIYMKHLHAYREYLQAKGCAPTAEDTSVEN